MDIEITGPQPGPQYEFLSKTQDDGSVIDMAISGGEFFGGKALTNDSMVVTPFGMKRNGDLKIGSQVSNPDGTVSTVVNVYDHGLRGVYKVTFEDGACVEATAEHLWKYRVGDVGRFKNKRFNKDTKNKEDIDVWQLGTTKMMMDRLNSKSRKNIIIPLTEPVVYTIPNNKKTDKWPIPGYSLGVFIGNGYLGCKTSNTISVTSIDPDCIKKVDEELIPHISVSSKKDSIALSYSYGTRANELFESVGLLKKHAKEKFIPKNYFTAPLSVRLDLARGLMDTDGYVDDRGHASYTTISEQLANDVQKLMWSLGYKASITNKIPKYSYKNKILDGERAYTVWINGRSCEDICYIKRKKIRAKEKKWSGRRVVSIEYSGTKECRCISVSNPNGLYLTNGFIVTHNSIAIAMDAARNIDHPFYRGDIFRRSYKQLTDSGGMCDICSVLYTQYGGVPTDSRLKWTFPSGASIILHHLQHDSDMYNYRSSQFCFLGIDQVEEFPMEAVFYLSARCRPAPNYNRVVYRRFSCNPEPGWLADFIQYYWDPDTGYHIPGRSGDVRYFTRERGRIIWVDKNWTGPNNIRPMSFTYIYMPRKENKVGMKLNPNYESTIATMDEVSMERYGKGNWKINYSGGMFRAEWFKKVTEAPKGTRWIRYWDFAASEVAEGKDPDFTAGVLIGIYGGDVYIGDSIKFREEPGTTINRVVETAKRDGPGVSIRWEEEKGSAGKFNTTHLAGLLVGYDAQGDKVHGNKVERAKPVSSIAKNGRMYLVDGPWIPDYLSAADAFPYKRNGIHIDEIDATSGGLKCLTMNKRIWEFFSISKTVTMNIDWDRPSKNIFHYGCVYQFEGRIYILCIIWDKSDGVMYVYDEKVIETIIPQLIAVTLVKTMRLNKVKCNKILCNELVLGEKNKSLAKFTNIELGKAGTTTRLSAPIMYDQVGAISYLEALFLNDLIKVNKACEVAAPQIAGWEMDENGDKPKRGFPFAEMLCMVSTELKNEIAKENKRKQLVDYERAI